MDLRFYDRVGRVLAFGLLALILGSCSSLFPSEQAQHLTAILDLQKGQVFRSKPYLELAAGLQAMPRDEAESQLRSWARSEKYEWKVLILCRMLFVDSNGRLLKVMPALRHIEGRFDGMYAIGSTNGSDWPDWPLTLVDNVPFSIMADYYWGGEYPPKSPAPFASEYLEYCLKEGQWTTQHYVVVDLAARQRALGTLLKSPIWKQSLREDEISYLTYQISEEAVSKAPQMPEYHEPSRSR